MELIVGTTLFELSRLIPNYLFNFLVLKPGTKRRRTTDQINAEKSEAALKEQAIQDRMDQLLKKEEEMKSNAAAADILNGMIKSGVAVQDRDGTISVPSASK